MPGMLIDVRRFVPEALAGFCDLYGGYVQAVPGGVIRSRTTADAKVALVIGGGSGHYPAFSGYVGAGLADGAVVGNIFASPSSRQVRDVAHAAQRGRGVVLAFGNYTGDVLNFELAAERLRSEGIETEIVRVTDDIASAPDDRRELRRGVAGDVIVFKIAGAAAERGLPLPDVAALARAANERTRSFGVAFRGCTVPGASTPLFALDEGVMGVGMGIHGEPGIRDQPLCTAEELADLLVTRLLLEAPTTASGRPVVLLNGLGATKSEELFYLWRHIRARLDASGIDPAAVEAGEFVTSFDMCGCSLTMGWLDPEVLELWHDPVHTPALQRGSLPVLQTVSNIAPAPPPAPLRGTGGMEGRKDVGRFVRVMGAIAIKLAEEEEELNRLDAVAGDGDHGRAMAAGAHAAHEAARAAADVDADLKTAFATAADAWCDAAGGTSGALWAAGLRAAASALPLRQGDAPMGPLRMAAEAVMRLAGARAGDKTLVDAMLGALEGGADRGWRGAADGANRAAAATAAMASRAGRSRPLAERSIGHPDAGATSFAMCAVEFANMMEMENDNVA